MNCCPAGPPKGEKDRDYRPFPRCVQGQRASRSVAQRARHCRRGRNGRDYRPCVSGHPRRRLVVKSLPDVVAARLPGDSDMPLLRPRPFTRSRRRPSSGCAVAFDARPRAIDVLARCLSRAGSAAAHSFGTVYNLPVPFWMYAYGASAALIVSFAIVAYFAGVPTAGGAARRRRRSHTSANGRPSRRRWLVRCCGSSPYSRCCSAIVAGLVGTRNLYANINMTLFWIVFVLGFFYLAAIVGDLYELANPWRALCRWIERVARRRVSRRAAPIRRWLGYYPALVLYVAFIWIELFAHTQPRSLAVVLLAYTAINFVGAAIVRQGRMVPLRRVLRSDVPTRRTDRPRRIRSGGSARRTLCDSPAKAASSGLLGEPAEHWSLLLFVLFMLSSTAFDGIHETLPWVTIFWKNIYPVLAAMIARPYLFFVDFYYYWQWAMLVGSPFVYLAIYLFFIWLTKLAAAQRAVGARACAALHAVARADRVRLQRHALLHAARLAGRQHRYAWSPIRSDSAGTCSERSELLSRARSSSTPGSVWHTQVGLILFGHIVGRLPRARRSAPHFANSAARRAEPVADAVADGAVHDGRAVDPVAADRGGTDRPAAAHARRRLTRCRSRRRSRWPASAASRAAGRAGLEQRIVGRPCFARRLAALVEREIAAARNGFETSSFRALVRDDRLLLQLDGFVEIDPSRRSPSHKSGRLRDCASARTALCAHLQRARTIAHRARPAPSREFAPARSANTLVAGLRGERRSRGRLRASRELAAPSRTPSRATYCIRLEPGASCRSASRYSRGRLQRLVRRAFCASAM